MLLFLADRANISYCILAALPFCQRAFFVSNAPSASYVCLWAACLASDFVIVDAVAYL